MAQRLKSSFVVRTHADITVVRFLAEDLMNCQEVEKLNGELQPLLSERTRKVVLDLQNVKYAGSSLLGMMLVLRKKLKEVGGRVTLLHTGCMEEILKVTHTATLFEMEPAGPLQRVA